MARGRMISKKISRSRQVNDLVQEVGCAGGLFITWLITNLDKEGRIEGDPEILKGAICPRVKECTVSVIEDTLRAAHRLQIINWYHANGDIYIYFPGFKRNQPGMRADREPESEIPSPPEWAPLQEDIRRTAGELPDDCRQDDGSVPEDIRLNRMEENGNKENGSEGKHMSVSTPPKPDDSIRTDIVSVFNCYRHHHPRSHRKPTSKSKEWKAIKARLGEGYTVDDLSKAIDGNHVSPWHCGENPNGATYNTLGLIVRDGDHVDQFTGIWEQHERGDFRVRLTEQSRRSISAAQAWVIEEERKEAEAERKQQTIDSTAVEIVEGGQDEQRG